MKRRSERTGECRVPELATLRIYRPSQLTADPTEMVIMMDGRVLTRLRNGQDWSGSVESGRHVLQSRRGAARSKPLEVLLAPGDDVQLEARIPVWVGRDSLVRTDGATTGSPARPQATQEAVQILKVTEMHRSQELIGTESRRIDNTSGSGRLTRTIRVTREWSRMISADLHETNKLSGNAQIGPNWLHLKAAIERGLEQTYTISASSREEFAEEIGIEVGPGADDTVVLTWKRIWQHGLADVLIRGRHVDVPFRVAVGVTFDQSSTSTTGSTSALEHTQDTADT